MTMIRKARISDAPDILAVINDFAAQGLMLPRALSEIYEHLRDFYVCEKDGHVAGCAALHVAWEGLGEIRSLAVQEDRQGRGVGKRLVESCLNEAEELGMGRVFALTYVPDFFRQFGFTREPKDKLPHKIWNDCLKCPKFPNCDEVAMILDLDDMDR
jgi:amino-acid N-acetyltransferase